MGNNFENINEMIELARSNNPNAQNDLGVYIMERASTRTEEEQAVSWFYRAAKQGHPQGMINYGMAIFVGKGTNKDIASGLFIIESAFLMGIENAISFIMSAIQDGDVDIKEIIDLSNKDIRAKWVIGICYDHGIGVRKNSEEAYKYIEESADDDNPVALWILMNFELKSMEPDWHYIGAIVDRLRNVVEKQIGVLKNKTIKNDIQKACEQRKEHVPYILMKVIPACTEKGEPDDKYVQDLLNGKLFMKALDQFGDIARRDETADNDFRGDILEGYSESFGKGYNPHLYKEDGSGIEHDGILGSIDTLRLRRKVYCLSAIDYDLKRNGLIRPSEKMKKFGKYAVVISDVDAFLSRLRKAFSKYCKENNANYEIKYDKVLYDVDLYDSFQYDEFHKSISYTWQNEFRISIDFSRGKFSQTILDNTTDFAKLTFPGIISIDTDPLSLRDFIYFELGDLRDICFTVEISELFDSGFSVALKKKPSIITAYETPHNRRPTFCKGVTEILMSDGKYHMAISKEAYFCSQY